MFDEGRDTPFHNPLYFITFMFFSFIIAFFPPSNTHIHLSILLPTTYYNYCYYYCYYTPFQKVQSYTPYYSIVIVTIIIRMETATTTSVCMLSISSRHRLSTTLSAIIIHLQNLFVFCETFIQKVVAEVPKIDFCGRRTISSLRQISTRIYGFYHHQKVLCVCPIVSEQRR